jgi:hypothetical protein
MENYFLFGQNLIAKQIGDERPKLYVNNGFIYFILYLFSCRKEGDHWKDQDVGGWTILKWNLDRMGWYRLD